MTVRGLDKFQSRDIERGRLGRRQDLDPVAHKDRINQAEFLRLERAGQGQRVDRMDNSASVQALSAPVLRTVVAHKPQALKAASPRTALPAPARPPAERLPAPHAAAVPPVARPAPAARAVATAGAEGDWESF